MVRGGLGGGAAPPPAADHSHVKEVHVECKENTETAPAGLFQHVAWFVASSLVLVHVLVGCFCGFCSMRLWLLSLLLVFADWCLLVGLWVAWPSDRVWWVVLPQGFTLKCDFVAGAGVGDEVQISWVSRPQPRKTITKASLRRRR